jgi:hypothetical protein
MEEIEEYGGNTQQVSSEVLFSTCRYNRKSGFSDIRKSGYPDFRESGNPDIRTSGNPGIRIPGNPDIRKSGYPDTRKSGYPDFRESGYPEIRISGHPDIRVAGNPDIRISGNPDIIRMSGYPDFRKSGYLFPPYFPVVLLKYVLFTVFHIFCEIPTRKYGGNCLHTRKRGYVQVAPIHTFFRHPQVLPEVSMLLRGVLEVSSVMQPRPGPDSSA